MEFIGQGLANIAAAVNGGYPVSGSLGRSMANWRSGARTRLAGPIGGVFVALVVLVAGPLVDHTPLASLAGILLVLASFCYLIQSFGTILLPQYKEVYATIGLLSIVEIVFPLWLLIKGVKDQPRNARDLASA